MSTVISVENLSKSYRLGQIGTGTLSRDLEIWLAKLRGKPNPYLKIGQSDPGELNGETLWALKDVSFQVQQGEVLGIIGRNGAGKSTLLKILSRVTAPTSGQVKVRGRIASLLEVGTGFHPELTGRENIFLNGAILGMSKQEVQRKFDEIVSFAEVEKFVDTPVKRYSSGMYVRLAFAVAAHLESEILLVDEVLAVGDAEFQKKSLGKMGDVAENEGKTVLFVSHNMAAIRNLTDRSILLSLGSKVLDGQTGSIIDNYLASGFNENKEQKIILNKYFKLAEIDFLDHRNETQKKESTIVFETKIIFYQQCNLFITVGINNSLDNRILTSWGYTEFNEEEGLNNPKNIKLIINNIILPPGQYSIMLGFRVNGIESFVFNDFMKIVIPQGITSDYHLERLGDKIGVFYSLNIK